MEEKQTAKTNTSTYHKEPAIEDNIATAENPASKAKKPKTKKFYLLLLLILLLGSLGAGTSVLGYNMYHSDLSLAQTGIQHLHNAATLLTAWSKKPLDSTTVTRAQLEFSAADTAFIQVNTSLQFVPAIATLVPVYGNRLSTATRLASLASEVSQAGIVGCAILKVVISRFGDPLHSAQNAGLTMADINVIANNLHQIRLIFALAVQQFDQLQLADLDSLHLDSRYSKLLPTFQQNIPAIQTWLQDAEALMTVAPALLGIGTPSHYLIELLDSTELRPGGGFIGNVGTATLSGGRLTDTHITDVYLFDNAFRAHGILYYPPGFRWFSDHLSGASWSLRDSNLEPDFPTTAQYSELNYQREGGNVALQGVIAITPALIQSMLAITGPIAVPEYHETVTPQNLIERIHYHQLGSGLEGADADVLSSDGHSSVRKRFTELLAEHFMARLHQLPSSSVSTILQILMRSLYSKDLQVYLNPPVAENVLKSFQLASTVQSPVDDGLFVVDANISPDKANALITNTLTDQVTIDRSGNATHHTTLNYVWGKAGDVYGTNLYLDYVRAYMPPNSRLLTQSGWKAADAPDAYGLKVAAGFFTLTYQHSVTITLVWMVPHAAKQDALGWHYQYEIQRQSGANWNLSLAVNLPTCAVVKNTSGGLTHSHKQLASLTQPLTQDLLTGIDYTCSP